MLAEVVNLRGYQTILMNAVRDELLLQRKQGVPTPSVCAQAPTGAGKTVLFVKMCADLAATGRSTLILSHRQELIKQISKALSAQGVRHGIIAPGQPSTNDLVQIASVQTLAPRIKKGLYNDIPYLVVIDECHHANAKTWEYILEWCRGKSRVVGVTATPERTDGSGLDDKFNSLILGPSVKWLTTTINPDTGMTFLSPPRVYAPPSVVDMSKVKTNFGDYKKKDLEEAVDKATVTGDAVEHYKRLAMGMPAVAFCVTVEHAEHVAEQFRKAGIPAASVDGNMSDDRRADVIKSLSDGRILVLTSCELISEGFDLPKIAVAILLRPTQSLTLYLQQVGRALRPFAGKLFAIILDHVGNCRLHGMPDDDRIWTLQGESKQARKKRQALQQVRTCKVCFAAYVPPADGCPACGAVFAKEEMDVDQDTKLVAVSADVLLKDTSKDKEKKRKAARTIWQLYEWAQEYDYKPSYGEKWWLMRVQAAPLYVKPAQAKALLNFITSELWYLRGEEPAMGADIEYILAWQSKRKSDLFNLSDLRGLVRFRNYSTNHLEHMIEVLQKCNCLGSASPGNWRFNARVRKLGNEAVAEEKAS